MKPIKPPKKRRLIASWRAYKRWYDENYCGVFLMSVPKEDGSHDIYAFHEGSNYKRYLGSFRTTTVIRNKDDESKCVCGEVSVDQNIEIAIATGNWDCTVNGSEHNFTCDHCSYCGVSKYDEND